MNLFLGIYKRKPVFDFRKTEPVVRDFCKNRESMVVEVENFRLYCSSKNETDKFYCCEKQKTICAVGGNMLNYSINKHNPRNSLALMVDEYFRTGESTFFNHNGEYAFVFYDGVSNKLIVGNNEFGTFPVFYYYDEEIVIVCNEYEPIVKYKNFAINKTSIAEFFLIGAPTDGKTFFIEINNLAPASILTFSNTNISNTTFNNRKILINRNASLSENAAVFAGIFRDVIKSRETNTYPMYCSLSGGIDTRLIVSALSEKARGNTQFISLLTEPLDENSDQDVIIASIIAKQLGLKHQIIPISQWWKVWSKQFDIDFFDDLRYTQMPYIFSGHFGSELVKGEFIKLIPEELIRSVSIKEYISQHELTNRVIHVLIEKHKKNNHIYTKLLLQYIPEVAFNTVDNYMKCQSENKILEFAIRYMTRSFFSTLYSGSFGSWLSTYRFSTYWNLPFIDRRILNFLLTVPMLQLINRQQKLYNELYLRHFTELQLVPTNADISHIAGNCLLPFNYGIEPKSVHKPMYEKAFEKLRNNQHIQDLAFFNCKKINRFSNRPNNIVVRPAIEYAVWADYIFDRRP